MTVQVLLATFNGAPHVGALLDSVLAQTLPGVRILTRDDGSSDDTPSIVEAYARRHPDRIQRLENGPPSGSAMGNFARLIDAADAPYIAFADQDDIWLPHKLALALDRMRAAEAKAGQGVPVLVHTDLTVVDGDLAPVAPSYWGLQGTDPLRRCGLADLLAENVVTGCAMLANRALVELARPVPAEAVMHDWWLALHAAAFGRLVPVAEPTLLYRRHGGNAVGVEGWDGGAVWRQLRRLRHPFDAGPLLADLRRSTLQADAFSKRHDGRLDERQRAMLAAFAALPDRPSPLRKATLLRWGIGRSNRLRHVSLLLRI